MKILYIAHRIPYPPNKGDKIRAFHEVQALAGIAEIFLCALVDDPEDWKYESVLRKLCSDVILVKLKPCLKKVVALRGALIGVPMSVLYFYEKQLQEAVDRLLEEHVFQYIVCFSGTSAEYVFKSKHAKKLLAASCDRPYLIMDFCDVDSLKWKEYVNRSNFPACMAYRAEGYWLARYESKIAQHFDKLILITEHEKQLFSKHVFDSEKLIVMGNGVDTDFFKPVSDSTEEGTEQTKPPELLFVGAMDYYANIDGVCWFAKFVWPSIVIKHPEAVFTIVGRNPAKEVLSLQRLRNIIVTGGVDDVRPYYQRATVVIVPLRIARGIQNKVLESMAMGKATIVSVSAFSGLGAKPNSDLLVAEDSIDFIREISDTISNSSTRIRLENNGRFFVETEFAWKDHMIVIVDLIRRQNRHLG